MSKFEDRLWAELVREHADALTLAGERADEERPRSRWRSPSAAHRPSETHRPGAAHRPGERRRLLRRRGRRVLAGALAVVALAGAGTAVFGPRGNPRDIASFECGANNESAYSGQLVSANPVSACAALWPSLYHHAAPELVAWVAETGGVVYVLPASSPPLERGWRRLPPSWRANTVLIELNDQLEDITTGLPTRPCWTAPAAAALVDSILRGDGLAHWRVRLQTERAAERHTACLTANPPPSVDAGARSVLLRLSPQQPPAGGSPVGAAEGRRLTAVETRVNGVLRTGGHCATVSQAAALWRADARAGGIRRAHVNLYSLAPEPGTRAACARIIVDVLGGGTVNVLAVDYP